MRIKQTELREYWSLYLSHSRCGKGMLCFLLFLLFFPGFLTAQNDSIERHDTIPPDNSRYLYLKKQLSLEFTVTLNAGQNNYFTHLLQISSNENEYFNLFLDYQLDTPKQLILYSRTNIRKLPIPPLDSLQASPAFKVKLLFNQQNKDFNVQVADTVYQIDNLGFNPKAGYKFSFPLQNEPVLDAAGQQAVQVGEIRFIQISDRRIPRTFWYWFIFILIIDLLIFGAVHLRKRRIRQIQAESAAMENSGIEQQANGIPTFSPPLSGAIYLFGGLHIYDVEGNNITKKFTPLLKELLLLILIYTPEKGITSERLREILWFDKSEQSAKNNRAVNMGKLRTLLESVGEIEITNKNGTWELLINNEAVYVDYFEYIRLYQKKKISSRNDIFRLFGIVQQGAFLNDVNYEWLDRFKSRITDFIIDSFTYFAEADINVTKEPDLALKIAESIFKFDHLNEFALQLQIQAYVALGKHSLAKKAYEKFTKDYLDAYDQRFDKSFIDIR